VDRIKVIYSEDVRASCSLLEEEEEEEEEFHNLNC
jgi:hypothetical protein